MDNKTLENAFTKYQAQGEFNALNFLIRNTILNTVNVAIPVRVDSVERNADGMGAGYLSATPLIQQRDASGNALPNVSIPKLRYFRYQHGTASIICDPKVGDVGLAVFAHQDVSGLDGGNEPKPPLSFRVFDVSDGFYLFRGLLGANSNYLHPYRGFGRHRFDGTSVSDGKYEHFDGKLYTEHSQRKRQRKREHR